MTVIPVPRPRNAMNPDRPVNALLLAQVQHLQQAEQRLPLRYRTEIYTHAIQTEAEAARYIREVTEAIHRAHADSAAQRISIVRRRKPGLAIAAAAEPAPKRRSKAKTKRSQAEIRKRKS